MMLSPPKITVILTQVDDSPREPTGGPVAKKIITPKQLPVFFEKKKTFIVAKWFRPSVICLTTCTFFLVRHIKYTYLYL